MEDAIKIELQRMYSRGYDGAVIDTLNLFIKHVLEPCKHCGMQPSEVRHWIEVYQQEIALNETRLLINK